MIEEGEDASAFESFTIDDAGGAKTPAAPPKEEASESSEPADPTSSTAPPPKEDKSEKKSEKAPAVQEDDSPSTGRLQNALDRINAKPAKKESAAAAPSSATSAPASTATLPNYVDTPTSSMRKTIANRLTQSFTENPHYFVAASCSVTKLLKLRAALNASSEGAYKLSVNDFLVKAVAVACKKVPVVNSSWRDGFIREYKSVDVSVAVATPSGLMTPIVKNVEGLGLSSISSAVKDLGKRARDGKLKPEEYQGGSITISNMGMNSAIDRFTAIINPPQACILAVGTTKKVAIPVESEEGTSLEWDDQIVVTGSFDHKVVDGAVGGEWIREFKKAVENPLELML